MLNKNVHLRLLVSGKDAHITATKSPSEIQSNAELLTRHLPNVKHSFTDRVTDLIVTGFEDDKVAESLRSEVDILERRFRGKAPRLFESQVLELVLRTILVLKYDCNFITAKAVTDYLWKAEKSFMLDLQSQVCNHYYVAFMSTK